jgi:hypothetical protein
MAPTPRVTIERRILLFEIERRCSFVDCNARAFIGLTKDEALRYNGFDCTECERWNSDHLNKTDIPDWWDEISSSRERAH